jgi:hypothetical protein
MSNLDSFNRKKLITSTLSDAKNALNSAPFLLWLDGQPADVQRDVSKLMLKVGLAHAKMLNATLAAIVTEMDKNADEIEAAIESLDDAIVTLNKEIEMIQEIADFINILKPVFALI